MSYLGWAISLLLAALLVVFIFGKGDLKEGAAQINARMHTPSVNVTPPANVPDTSERGAPIKNPPTDRPRQAGNDSVCTNLCVGKNRNDPVAAYCPGDVAGTTNCLCLCK